jgi:hypothetical protein
MPFFKALENLGDLIALFLSPYFPFFFSEFCAKLPAQCFGQHQQKSHLSGGFFAPIVSDCQ